jgi:3-oxoacyl-[acyl-carrier protein] reductase
MIPIDLSGKVALITGASQGIGAQIARTFHRAGATVVINHPGFPNTAADAQALADELNVHRSDSARVIAADVSKPEQVQLMMGEVQATCGALDYLVNNAAIIKDRTIAKMSLDEWDATLTSPASFTAANTRSKSCAKVEPSSASAASPRSRVSSAKPTTPPRKRACRR